MPAITRVAAWMSALTGVGPSIASGSQTWKGNCADLPATPMKMSAAERLRLVEPISPASARAKISCMEKVPAASKRTRTPMRRATSPTRVTMKAFLAASAADRRSE